MRVSNGFDRETGRPVAGAPRFCPFCLGHEFELEPGNGPMEWRCAQAPCCAVIVVAVEPVGVRPA